MIGIYKITNQITNQVYIGQSVQIERRWKEHKSKSKIGTTKLYQAMSQYGLENFQFEVIEECEPKELDEKERYWIKYYNSFEQGYNMNAGGQNLIFENAKIVQDLWDQGFCVSDISEKSGFCKATIQNYLIGYKNYSASESHRRGGIKANLKANKIQNLISTIFQYDKNGNFIKEWVSTKQIERDLGINACSVGKVLRGIRDSVGGYYWSHEKVETLKNIKPIKSIKKVAQYDLNGNYIATFNNCTEAAKTFGKKDGSFIGKVCNGQRNNAYGYIWKFVEE